MKADSLIDFFFFLINLSKWETSIFKSKTTKYSLGPMKIKICFQEIKVTYNRKKNHTQGNSKIILN